MQLMSRSRGAAAAAMRWRRTPPRPVCGRAAAKDGRGRHVVVGMSGGVDSSVAAMLLRDRGFRVTGVHMSSWDSRDERGECTGEADAADAERVCAQLGVRFERADFVREYWNDVFEAFLRDCEAGLTPNPDVLCNRNVKFGSFAAHAFARLGADLVATGHYARVGPPAVPGGPRTLRAGADPAKDQSYFLSRVRPGGFDRVLFPLGGLLKGEVRRLAEEAGLATARKRESMGICFVGKRKFADFVGGFVDARPGDVLSLEDGRRLGPHRGIWALTVGQGAGVGGLAERWFVAGKDLPRGAALAVPGSEHPALRSRSLLCAAPDWISGGAPAQLLGRRPGGRVRLAARTRHLAELEPCTVELADPAAHRASATYTRHPFADDAAPWSVAGAVARDPGALAVLFDRPVRAPTPGQTVALYDGDTCLGGAPILVPGPSEWEEAGNRVPSF